MEAVRRVVVLFAEKMASYWWVFFSQMWYLATFYGLREGVWVYSENEEIFGIPGHERTKSD
jgi:hypothetical protein